MLTRGIKNLIMAAISLALFAIIVAKFWSVPEQVLTPMRLWMVACPILVVLLLLPAAANRAGKRLYGAVFMLIAFGLTHVVFAFIRQDPSLWLAETIWAPFGAVGIAVHYWPEPAQEDGA